MSYILEALKKADQEHDLGTVPNLSTPQEPAQPERRSLPWPWIIAVLLLVNVLLVVALLVGKSAKVTGATVATQTVSGTQPEAEMGQALDAVPQQAAQTPPAQAVTDTQTPVRAPTALPNYPANTPEAVFGEVVVVPGPDDRQETRPLAMPARDPGIQVDVTTVVDDHAGLPSWFELPLDFRNKLDLPRLDVHVYSDDPQARFILVNLEKFREGDTLKSGLLLEEILPDGMVFSFRGERFRVNK